jgi:2-methylisocitrate lyase-like PEP mutase family enzyme
LNRAATLRKLLTKSEMLIAPGCHDPLGARLIEELGFPAVYLGGFATGAGLVHTEPLLQMNDQSEAAARIAKVIDVPLIADAHAGWGDALHTIRTVREFEFAGVSAFHIEDQPVPKRASYFRNIIHIMPRDDFIKKIKFAVQARQNPDTVIIGRTDAFSMHEGTAADRAAEAIARARAMMDVGADLIFLRGVTALADMEYFVKALPGVPQMTITHGDMPTDVYQKLGFKLLTYPTASVVVAYDALKRLYTSIRDNGRTTSTPKEYWAQREAIFKTLRQEEMWNVEEQTSEGVVTPRAPFIPELVDD